MDYSLKVIRKNQDQMEKTATNLGSYRNQQCHVNKWHQERMMLTLIGKDSFKEVPNQRYFDVSHLTNWLTQVSET